VATAAPTLPAHVPRLHVFAVVWAIAASTLVLLSVSFAVHWCRHR
jgi:hypothetical protein